MVCSYKCKRLNDINFAITPLKLIHLSVAMQANFKINQGLTAMKYT